MIVPVAPVIPTMIRAVLNMTSIPIVCAMKAIRIQ
jgi:hypothetical protein